MTCLLCGEEGHTAMECQVGGLTGEQKELILYGASIFSNWLEMSGGDWVSQSYMDFEEAYGVEYEDEIDEEYSEEATETS